MGKFVAINYWDSKPLMLLLLNKGRVVQLVVLYLCNPLLKLVLPQLLVRETALQILSRTV
jgi:hypothetical protein